MLNACLWGSARAATIIRAPKRSSSAHRLTRRACRLHSRPSGTQRLMHKPRAFAWTHVTPREARDAERRFDGVLTALRARVRKRCSLPPPRARTGKARAPHARYPFHPFFGSQRPRTAPVGSTIILNLPAPITSISSVITLAPSVLALPVAALRSSTCT